MSKLSELIEKLCPDGVEYRELGRCLGYEQPGKYIVKSENYDDKFATPVLTAGQSFLLGYTDETDGIYKASSDYPTIIFDDFTTSFHWVCFDFKVKSSAMKMLRPIAKDCIFKYAYYAMSCIRLEIRDHSRQWIGKYSKIKIPIPPIEVQEEIVRILDTFAEINDSMQREIDLRTKQYEYYRDSIIAESSAGDATTIKEVLKEKGYIRGPFGSALKKCDMVLAGIPVYEQQHAIDGHRNFRYFITDEKAEKLKRFKVQKNDLIISCSGTVGCVSIVGENDKIGVINQALLILRVNPQKANIHYLKYFFETEKGHAAILNKTNEGAQINVCSREQFEQISLPAAHITIQEQVVNKIDIFHESLDSLQSELELRKKQFEFYRDKLLDLPKKA